MSEERFSFGENWKKFASSLSDEQISSAETELKELFGDDFRKGTFLDAGCGSGLFSLAALELGATVHAFDYDEDSVECTEHVLSEYGSTNSWTVERGDLVDSDYMAGLGRFDSVYCWGVAHHTGSMWQAIANAAEAVSPGGRLVLGLYNYSDEGWGTTRRWKFLKRFYVRSPRSIQSLLQWYWITVLLTYRWKTMGESPLENIRNEPDDRGMTFATDATDWIGGYPYEAARPGNVVAMFDTLANWNTVSVDIPAPTSPSAVNTYVFTRPADSDTR